MSQKGREPFQREAASQAPAQDRVRGRPLRVDGLSVAILVLSAVAVAAVAVGFTFRLSSFATNLVATLAGVAAPFVVAAIGIERLTERRRRERWHAVQALTIQSICASLVAMALEAIGASPVETLARVEGIDYGEVAKLLEQPAQVRTAEAIFGIGQFIGAHAAEFLELEERRGRWRDSSNIHVAGRWTHRDMTSRSLHDRIRLDMLALRDVLTPRVLEFADDPALVECLLNLQNADRAWTRALRLLEVERDYRSDLAWRSAGRLYEAAGEVAARVAYAAAAAQDGP